MKSFICLGLFLFVTSVFADIIKVKGVKADGELERSLVLTTNLPEKVVLDCQSFIQGLRFGEGADATVLMMEEWECGELQGRVKNSVRRFQKHCIDIEADTIRSDYSC